MLELSNRLTPFLKKFLNPMVVMLIDLAVNTKIQNYHIKVIFEEILINYKIFLSTYEA